jgi:hypothetical protein
VTLVRHDTDLWSSEFKLAWQGGLVPIPVRTTVIRLRDGSLVVHSPGPLGPELLRELDALGRVAFLVIPYAHGKYAEAAARAFPSARLLAASEPPRARRSLPFHGALADDPPAEWAGQIDTHRVRGFRLNEVVLFHRASRTLVITDLAFNIQESDSRFARLFFRAEGMWRRFAPSLLLKWFAVSDRRGLDASIERILRWNFERILPGHGAVLEHGGPEHLRMAWPR